MAEKKTNLYRWERFSKPRVYSRSQKITTNNDIQDWIKTVEDASSRAAAVAFDEPYSRGRNAAKSRVEDARVHDAAYSEAQELLQQWVSEKVNFDDDDDVDFESEPWMSERSRPKKSQSEIKREWDNLVADNDPDYDMDLEALKSPVSASAKSKAFYSKVLDDENETDLNDIISSMMKKQVVGDYVVKDLGLDKDYRKAPDLSTKMAVRQQQVKENREKREAEKRRKLQEAQSQKEAKLQAKMMIQKEESEKESRRKKEEWEINKEMARIRKEMAEERQWVEEKKRKERLEKELRDQEAAAELQRQKLLENEARKIIRQEDTDRQRKIADKIQQAEAKNLRERLTLLHRYFGMWYQVVAERRVELGKARAMADWKLLLKAWKCWRIYHKTERGNNDAMIHMQQVRAEQRNKLRATEHYRLASLRRCFAAWLLHVSLERRQKELHQEQKVTQNKMAAFLQAASSGSLWQKENNMRKSTSMEHIPTERQESARQRVDDMFSQPGRQRRGSLSSRSAASSTTATERSEKSNRSRTKQPWQITRKDAKLTKSEFAKYSRSPDKGQGEGSTHDQDLETERSDASTKTDTSKASRKQPWEKKYVVNSTEHRTAAQAKMLEEQQKQIKEQQRLITELTYLQKQQLFQTQLTQQQLLRQQATGMPAAMDVPKLEAHIQELQKQLLAQGGAIVNGESMTSEAMSGLKEDGSVASGSDVALETARTDSTVSTLPSKPSTLTKKNIKKINASEGKGDSNGATTGRSKATSSALTTNRTESSGNSKHTTFLQAMEERSAERARLKAEREEKKRKADQERLAKLAAEAEEERKLEEEEKKKKADEYREKKRLDREREAERLRQAALLRHNQEVAESHHLRALVKYRGWLPWRRLVEIMNNRMTVAETHHRDELLRKVLLHWHTMVQEELEHKNGLADEMHKYVLIRRCFRNWRRVGECVAIQEEKAQRFYTSRLVSRIFTSWRDYTEDEKVAFWQKERKAKDHNLMRMKKRVFNTIRSYPEKRRQLEDKEKRRKEMRLKVQSMLPDYEARSKPLSTSASQDFDDLFSHK